MRPLTCTGTEKVLGVASNPDNPKIARHRSPGLQLPCPASCNGCAFRFEGQEREKGQKEGRIVLSRGAQNIVQPRKNVANAHLRNERGRRVVAQMTTITQRVNTINGRTYANDPTIFAWCADAGYRMLMMGDLEKHGLASAEQFWVVFLCLHSRPAGSVGSYAKCAKRGLL